MNNLIKQIKADKRLRPFQRDGLIQIEKWNGRCILADEMGLGKTIQILSWLNYHPEIRPAVLVVPPTLKDNWLEHSKNWLDDKAQVINSPDDTIKEKVIIVSYNLISFNDLNKKIKWFSYIKSQKEIIIFKCSCGQLLHKVNFKRKHVVCYKCGRKYEIIKQNLIAKIRNNILMNKILELNPKFIAADEAHYIKNPTKKRTKAFKKIAKNCKYIIPITGTPIENNPIEFFTMLNIIRRDLFPVRLQYAIQFCGGKRNNWGWDFSGSSNTKLLHKIVTENCMIRRLKKNVLKDLPDKTKNLILLDPEPKAFKEYQKALTDTINWIKLNYGNEKAKRAKRALAIVKINYLSQLAFKCKEKSILDWISDFLESGEKLGIYAINHEAIDSVYNNFKKIAVKIDGRTKTKERNAIKDRFQNDPKTKLFVGAYAAAGVGLDLFAASNCGLIQIPWKSGQIDQAIDRHHRIGQKSAVNANYLICKKTIELDIYKRVGRKRQVIQETIDGKEVKAENEINILDNLINGLLEK